MAPSAPPRLLRFALAAIWLWTIAWLAIGDGAHFFGIVNALGFFWGGAAGLLAGLLVLRRAFFPALLAAIASGVILLHGQWPTARPSRPQALAELPRFRVVTASLRTYNRDMAGAARLLASYRPDILVVQEASNVPAFLRQLAVASQRRWQAVRRGNEVIASPWPILASLPDRAYLRAAVAVPGGPVTVWNIHAAKNYSDTMLMHLQIAALADDVRAHGPARIVAGDLNATPWNDSHRTLSAFLTDAFGVAGNGPGFTFPTRARRLGFAFPYLRIDHIFVDAALYPVTAQVGIASPGADHLPVVADLVRRPALQQNGE